ncbi:MAG: M23 family peptidase, partial [Rhodobacteraceae bacterium]|nr:M23 family peptidase [Paracoccaceae bacterium]
MRTRLAIKLHAWLSEQFPERRVFLKSDTDTRFIRLKPETQLIAFTGATALVAWAIIATAIILMDSIGAGNFREQAKRDQRIYQERLNDLAFQRDLRAEEALAAQNRFNAALKQISVMQSELLESENRRRELETGIEVIQATLRQTMGDRETARDRVAELESAVENGGGTASGSGTNAAQMTVVAEALARTAKERDQVVADAQGALDKAADLELELALLQDQNDQIFRQLEEAMAISMEPLDKMFRAAGMPTDRIIEQVRRGYSGQGGPL